MDYCDNPDVVFVAIPKTGTRSVVDYLKTHFRARRFKGTSTHTEVIPEQLRNHFAFTVVRNPYDRAVSYWWSTCKRPKGSQMSFEDFLAREGGSFQHPYLERNNLNKVIRYENLNEEFKQLPFFIEGTSLEWLNPTVQPWNGIPSRPPTEELLTPNIRKLIKMKFARDFEVCGYSTEYGVDK